eukprot:Sro4424_g353970.1 Retrotransposon protein (325) ;mRNA; r:373-1349
MREQRLEARIGVRVHGTRYSTAKLSSVGFRVVGNRARAMCADANIPDDIRHLVFPKAVETATKLDGLVPVRLEGTLKTRYEHVFGENPPYAGYLKTWGEAGTVTITSKLQPKGKDRGAVCMFVGYPNAHAGDCYKMWDPSTRRVHVSRDVVWLHRMYYKKTQKAGEGTSNEEAIELEEDELSVIQEEPERIDGEQEEEEENGKENVEERQDETQNEEHVPDTGVQTRSGRVVKPRDRLIETMEVGGIATDYEIGLTPAEERYYDAMERFPEAFGEVSCVGAGIGGGFTNTQELHVLDYNQAMATDDKKDWQKSVEEEYQRMVDSN